MQLTEVAIKNAKPREKPYKLSDERGLFLLVTPSGGKWWRFKYRLDGKEKLLSLGVYPDTRLAEAREKREEARRLVASGVDPSLARKDEKMQRRENAANTFEYVAREWLETASSGWTEKYRISVEKRLNQDVFPLIGKLPILEIKAPEILRALRAIEHRGAIYTARRALQSVGEVFQYAIGAGKVDFNPAAGLGKNLAKKPPVKNMASITKPKPFGELLLSLDGYEGSYVTKCALRLAPLVFVRPGELRSAEWTEIDFDLARWIIPAEKMKMRQEHIVPLSRQALEILRELQKLTGGGRYLFPSLRSGGRCMSNNTLNAALRRLGYSRDEVTSHGFRSSASTMLHEMGWPSDVIERQLAHGERNRVKGAYNRAKHLPERTNMMQAWADYLDGLRLSNV